MSRVPARLAPLRELGAEVVAGDLTDPASLARACDGAGRVLAAAHAFLGAGTHDMARVDDAGNRALVDAARAAGVRHFVLTSACYGPDDPVDSFRAKYAVEQYLRASGVPFTILRPGAFMEDHAERIGRPVVERGRTVVLGRGDRPANYVAVADVAHVAARVHRVPPGVLRAVRAVVGPALPAARRIVDVALFADTGRQALDTTATSARFGAAPTRLEEFVRRRQRA